MTTSDDPTAVAATISSGESARPRLREGTLIGRYRVVSLVGEGGMGVVYRARDPELGRDVAVKVIAPRHSGDDARAYLLREAQAMAKLRHANVVPIFDVGTVDDDVFVVMPLLEGGTLGGWLRQARRPWREVLDRFISAGRGLVAAHAAGLVHRDFKPDNVLLGTGGEVLVADFGLARDAKTDTIAPDRGNDDEPHTGVAGTLAYMAPEQLRGTAVDARADQFSFCVSLWEGLHGARPQDAETREAGLRGVIQRHGDGGRSIPGWLRSAVLRGLAHDPDARWPSLAALIGRLERRRQRAWRVALATATAAVATFAAIGVVLLGGDAPRVDCGRAGDVFAEHWTRDAAERLSTAFAGARPSGADVAERTRTALDAYGGRWRKVRIDACRGTHVRGDQSTELLDRRMRCLDRALMELDALLAVFATATGPTVDRAFGAVDALPAPEACDPAIAESAPFPDDPRVDAVTAALAAANAARESGAVEEARRRSTEALSIAEALGHPGLIADARVTDGMLLASSDPAKGRAAVETALQEAVRAGDHELEARIAIRLLEMANRSGDTARIESLLPVAKASVGRLPAASPWHRELARQEPRALGRLGRYDEGLAICDRLATLEDEPRLLAKECRCTLSIQATRNDAARAACADALSAAEKRFGPVHATMRSYLGNMEIIENRLGHYEAALALRERSLEITRVTFGPESDEMSIELRNRGAVLANMARYDDARRNFEAALEIMERLHDKPTRVMAQTHDSLGKALAALGDVDASLREADEGLRTLEAVVGADHPDMIVSLMGHGQVYMAAKRCDIALESHKRGAALAESKFGATHPLLAFHLLGKAQCLIEVGRPKEAIDDSARGLHILEQGASDPSNIASAHGILGHAYLRAKDLRRARGELEKARDMYASMGAPSKPDLDEVSGLIAELDRLSK